MSEPLTPGGTVRRRAIFWVCSLAMIGLLLALLLRPATSSRGPQRHLACKANLRTIEVALHNYHDEHGSFPPAVTHGPDGRPWHSWRVLLLPYVEQAHLYRRYRLDEPWNSPHNAALVGLLPRGHYYFCGSDPGAYRGEASYLAVVGDRTMWPGTGTSRLDAIPDGADRTVHLVEAWESGVAWTEPRDLAFETMTFAVNAASGEGVRGRHRGEAGAFGFGEGPPRVNVSFADGAVRPLTSDTPAATLKSLLLRDDGGPMLGERP